MNLTIAALPPGGAPVQPGPTQVAAQTAMWEQAKRTEPGLYRLWLALIEDRTHRLNARHARACTTGCDRPAVNRVSACGFEWLCDWCLAQVLDLGAVLANTREGSAR